MWCSICTNEPCEAHVLRKNTNSLCSKLFHIDCVASLEHKTYNQWQQTDTDSFLCNCCKYCSIIKPNDTPWEQLGRSDYDTKLQ